jgi:protein TonB
MFDELPETNHAKNEKKAKAILTAAIIQVVLVCTIILIQMVMPEKLGEFQLLTTLYMAPPPPPPAAHPHGEANERQKVRPAEPVEQREITAPTAIPKELPQPTESADGNNGVNGGLPGGVIGGTPGAVRVGGSIREPKILKMVQPVYPREAVKGRIEGVVLIEATVTEQGNVEKVTVISGPAMLAEAAVEAVEKWKYEPTVLNGRPVPVILTARVNFILSKKTDGL